MIKIHPLIFDSLILRFIPRTISKMPFVIAASHESVEMIINKDATKRSALILVHAIHNWIPAFAGMTDWV